MPQAPTWPPPPIPPPGPAGAAAGTVWTPLTLVDGGKVPETGGDGGGGTPARGNSLWKALPSAGPYPESSGTSRGLGW